MKDEELGGVELQERDFRILVDLFQCRVMALRHVCELHFDGRLEAAKKRVQKLKTAGLVKERARRIGDPSLLHLTRKALIALRRTGRLDGFPPLPLAVMEKRSQVSDLTIRHELEVMDVRTAFFSALRARENLHIAEFSTWPALYQFKALQTSPRLGRQETLMKPDGFLRIHEKEGTSTFEHLFFLEVDRSTETQDVLAQKAACYLAFYHSGGMAERFGAPRSDFREFPFRTLMIFRNEERRNNAAEKLLRNTPPIQTQVWLSTQLDVLSNPVGRIWMRPRDLVEANIGKRFDSIPSGRNRIYRRQNERENHIRETAKKHSIFQLE